MARAQILVADSDPGFAVGLAANLESLGYAVTEVVSSPEEALKKAEETRPDLVLLDLGLLRDGKEKAPQDLRKRIPNLVYLVGEEDRKTLQQAKITNSFDYLRKAYDSRELETIIGMALYRRKLEGESRRDQEKQRQVRQKWQQRDEKQTAKIGKISAALKTEIDRHQHLEETLQAERKKLFAVLDTLPAYVALLAPDYSMPYTNREFEKRFSAPEGRKCYEFLFGRTSPCPDCETYKVLQTNAPHEWEWTGPDGLDYQIYDFPFPDTDGSPLILEMGVDVTVLKEKEAQISKMAAALRRSYEELEARVQDRTQELAQSNAALQNEIAERLWSEKKLKESEERYRLLVDLSPDAIAVQSQGRYLFINPAGAQLFGAAAPREMVGKAVPDTIHPDYRQLVTEHICRVNAEGARTDLQEIKILRLDGQVVDVEASGVGINYQGQPAVQVMLRNITRRKEMEKKLEHQASFPRLNPNPVLEADASGNITYANAASLQALKKLGLDNQVRAFLPKDLDEIMKTAAETGETVFYREVEINRAFFGESISFPGEFEVIRIYARDITQQKRAEIERQEFLEKLQASEEELQVINEELQVQNEELQAQAEELLASNQSLNEAHTALRESREDLNRAQAVAHTGSWRLDVRQNELLWSDETYRIFGISQGTPLTYEAFLAAVHPEDRDYVGGEWTAALGGKPYDLEHRIVVGNTVKWVREKAELEFAPQGQLLGGFGTVQDITARKLSEEALRREKNISDTTIESLPGIFYLFDSQGRFLRWNKNYERVSGYTSEELSRMSPLDFFVGEDKQLIEQRIQEVFAKGEASAEAEFVSKDGPKTPYFFTGLLTTIDNSNCLIGMGIDITERKRAEETLQTSRNFLEIANRHTRMAPLLKDYAAAVKEHAGCEAVAIRILDEQGRIPYEAYEGFPPEFIACESPLSIHADHCLCINVCKGATDSELSCYTSGSSCYINSFSHLLATTPPCLLGETRNICHQFGYESVSLIPIVFGGQILGLIHLADHRENMVPLSLVERLERIGLQLGTAINRVRAEEALRRALADSRQRQAEISALLKATRAVLKAREFKDISRAIYDSCRDLIGASSGYVALLSQDGQENEVLFLDTGGMRCTVDPSLPMPIRGLRAEAYHTCKTLYDNDFAHSDYAEFLPRGHAGLDNVLFSPLVVKGKAVGLLGLGNKPGGYTENDARLAAGFGELAAMALANKRAEEERERLIRELETERARLQAIIESAPEAIVVVDEDGRLLLINPAAGRLYSHSNGGVKDAASCALFQFCHADGTICIPGDQPLLRSAKEGEIHRNVEMVLAWPDGRRRDLLVNTAPILDQQGRSSGAVGLFQDITGLKEGERERRRLMQELEEQRVLLEAVLQQMPAGLVVMSAAGKLVLANEQVEQIFRQPVPQDIGLEEPVDFKLFHQDGRPYRLEDYPLALALRQGEIIFDEDINFERQDDSRGILRCSAAPIRDRHGDIMAAVATFCDITERKQAELELARRTAEFEAIFNSITDAVVFTDSRRRLVMVNPAMTTIFGYSPQELYGKTTKFLYAHKADYEEQGRKRYHTGAAVDRSVFQVPYRRKDGTVFIGETLGTQVKDATGKVLGFVGIHRDITQRKRAEEKIRKLNAELSDRIREVSERTLQLQAANKELEAFSYSVSHDLRTPLRAIEGFARILMEEQGGKLTGEAQRLLDVIRSNTRIMGELIDDLLALSRLGRQEIRAQEIDLEDLVTSAFGELQAQEPERRLELILNPLPPAFGDRNLITQVLANLLGNAVKFTHPREKAIIEVGGWTEGKENIYFIKDNGVGFDMRYVGKIFGVFQRLHRREDFEGTGVGLAIVQRIINRHGGRVWATGKVDRGGEFYFTLPVKGEAN